MADPDVISLVEYQRDKIQPKPQYFHHEVLDEFVKEMEKVHPGEIQVDLKYDVMFLVPIGKGYLWRVHLFPYRGPNQITGARLWILKDGPRTRPIRDVYNNYYCDFPELMKLLIAEYRKLVRAYGYGPRVKPAR